jgi:hypothetical protein
VFFTVLLKDRHDFRPYDRSAARILPPDTMIDGEVIVIGPNGRVSFNALQHASHTAARSQGTGRWPSALAREVCLLIGSGQPCPERDRSCKNRYL